MTDADIITRLSALEEPWILSYFWDVIRRGADHMAALVQLTQVTVQRPAAWAPDAVRSAHQHGPRGIATRQCFGCRAERKLYVHHVIEIQHGGSNDPRNRVPLCFSCHQRLHPWLQDEPARHEFESVREIMPRVLQSFEAKR
jgi:5-methylcytosine-specific restriction endonuclease McrA